MNRLLLTLLVIAFCVACGGGSTVGVNPDAEWDRQDLQAAFALQGVLISLNGLNVPAFGLSPLDHVVGVPDLPHREDNSRSREVRAADELLDALPADAEHLSDFLRADQVVHG